MSTSLEGSPVQAHEGQQFGQLKLVCVYRAHKSSHNEQRVNYFPLSVYRARHASISLIPNDITKWGWLPLLGDSNDFAVGGVWGWISMPGRV